MGPGGGTESSLLFRFVCLRVSRKVPINKMYYFLCVSLNSMLNVIETAL